MLIPIEMVWVIIRNQYEIFLCSMTITGFAFTAMLD